MITRFVRPAIVMLATLGLLAGCGGGGGGGGATQPTQPFRINITAQDTTLSGLDLSDFPGTVNNSDPGSGFATQVNVTVRQTDGQPVPDGTPVTLSVSNPELGTLATIDGAQFGQDALVIGTLGGNVSAVFRTEDETGQVTVQASAFDANANRTVSDSVVFNIGDVVVPPAPPEPFIELTTVRDTIPLNTFGVPPFLDSPFLTEVTVTIRDADGVLVEADEDTLAAGITPVLVAAFSTPDREETEENDFLILLANGPINAAAGTSAIFVHSLTAPGVATLRVTGQYTDADGVTFNLADEIDITVVQDGANGVPANVSVTPATPLLYIQGSGGQTSSVIQIQLTDGALEPAPDPGGSNNLRVEVVTEQPNSGEILSGTNASGTTVEGTSIDVRTTAGISSVSLRTGTESGLVRVRVIADAADNNVDNGIQAPITDEFSIEVSDGIPFAIRLATAFGAVDSRVTVVDPDPEDPFNLASTDVFSLLVQAIVTDRRGNPPARPVTVEFGLLDTPTDGFPFAGPGAFSISGPDGDPQEAGINFFAPTGEFTTAGGGAGPGDTLVLFGRDVVGNSDLEGARQVASIIDSDNLTVTEEFNRNDTTGSLVDNGAVIPYAIGRANLANIETGITTDENGVATTFLNYPVSVLGRSVIIYAQGRSVDANGTGDLETYADVGLGVFPGVAGFTLTAAPSQIRGNATQTVEVCAVDGAALPIPGLVVRFNFTGVQGTAMVDGIADSGRVANPTGVDGCTLASVTTTGVLAGDNAQLTFTAGGAQVIVDIDADGNAIMQLDPNFIVGNRLDEEVLIRLLSSSGQPIEGVQIDATCTANGADGMGGSVNFLEFPGATDENGETTAVLRILGLDALCPDDDAGDAECVFSTADGAPSQTLSIQGRGGLLTNFSPTCDDDGPDTATLNINFAENSYANNPPDPSAVRVIDSTGDINCTYTLGSPMPQQTGSCSATYDTRTPIVLTLEAVAAGTIVDCMGQPQGMNQEGCFDRWAGACISAGPNNRTATLTLEEDAACIPIFQ